jgi:hypothetical protein
VDVAGAFYADHLTNADLQVLADAGHVRTTAAELRRHPDVIPQLLADPRVFEAVSGERTITSSRTLEVSPFLLFAVAVHRAAHDLASMLHVPERTGFRQRVPVFDAAQLAAFLDSPARKLFLTELLASFTKIASGRYRVNTGRGWRWRRFSELDPPRLAGLLEAVGEAERPGVYRRLGDVALFLAGVFPEYAQDRALSSVDAARLLRVAGVGAGDDQQRVVAMPAIELFEYLGAHWYRNAWQLAEFRTQQLAVVAEVAERFRQARRVLNHITDRYLFPVVKGATAG